MRRKKQVATGKQTGRLRLRHQASQHTGIEHASGGETLTDIVEQRPITNQQKTHLGRPAQNKGNGFGQYLNPVPRGERADEAGDDCLRRQV